MTVLPLRHVTGAHRVTARAMRAPRPALPTTVERLEAALGPQYKVVRTLGQGGYGEVFLVRDAMLHRVLAVKVLRDVLAADPRERERFRREARTVAHLVHPGIVPVLAYGEEPAAHDEQAPLCWTMMPCASGGSLAGRIGARGGMAPARVATILAALCDALAHAHRHGVVHCDLKPDNVLFAGEDERPLLTDFGVAARPHHDAGIVVHVDVGGTPQWMAPEQRFGLGALDARSDVHGVGMLGWVMLAGKLPGRYPDGRPDRRELPADCPSPLAAALERALLPNPERRWSSASALQAALVRAAWPAWRRVPMAWCDALVAKARELRSINRRWRMA